MRYFKFLARFSVPTAPTAPTFGRNTVGTLFPQGRNTGRNTFSLYAALISRLKWLFFHGVSRDSRNTFPSFAQEIEKEDYGRILCDDREPIYHDPYDGDEFDHEDYDEWFENWEEAHGISWEERAVDEAIDEERFNGALGDIPF